MDLHLLNQMDVALSKCGRPVLKPGLSTVPLGRGLLVQGNLAVGQRNTLVKTITGEATWALRSISIFATAIPLGAPSVYLQVQLPNGRFLQNNFQDITQISGFGSWRFTLSRELDCVPGSKIQVTLDDIIPGAAVPQVVIIVFEGAYKYYLESGRPGSPALVEPRYLATTNQNILAPCWMSGQGPPTPSGYRDTYCMYNSDIFTATIGGTLVGTTQIQIDNDSEFVARKLILSVIGASTVTAGTFLGQIRLASGYAFFNDFLDLRMYLQNSPWAHDWNIPAGERVFTDLEFVDAAGTGAITAQLFLEGVKRRRVA